MDQDALKTSLNGLERKVSLLIQSYKTIKQELEAAESKVAELREAIKKRDEQLDNFKNQIKITKIVGQINTESESVSELKRKVDEFIREIDNCIAHASR